jgi:hypothetical protein
MMEGKRNVAKRSNTTSFSQTKHKTLKNEFKIQKNA